MGFIAILAIYIGVAILLLFVPFVLSYIIAWVSGESDEEFIFFLTFFMIWMLSTVLVVRYIINIGAWL